MKVKIIVDIPGNTLEEAVDYALNDLTVLTERAEWTAFDDSAEAHLTTLINDLRQIGETSLLSALRGQLLDAQDRRDHLEFVLSHERDERKDQDDKLAAAIVAIEAGYDSLLARIHTRLPVPPITALRRLFVDDNYREREKKDRDVASVMKYLETVDQQILDRNVLSGND